MARAVRRCSVAFLLAGCFAFVLAACSREQASQEPVVLGAIYDLSGSQAVLDVPSLYGARLAADEINAGSGVLDRPLLLVEADGESRPRTVADETAELLRRHPSTVALLGLSDTDMALAAARVAAARDRVFLSSGATSPRLPEEVPTYLFLACFGDNVQAAAGAEWAHRDLSARKVAILFDPNESYTRLLQGYFATRFQELGGDVASVESLDPDDLPETWTTPADVDLVFLAVETAEDAVRVVPWIRGAGFRGPILGGDGFDAEPVWAAHPDVSDVYFTTHVYLGSDSPSEKVRAFLEAYAAAHPDRAPSAFSALGYDAVGLLTEAISRAGDPDPEAVREALSQIDDYEGVTGAIRFTAGSRVPTKTVTILRVSAGEAKLVRRLVPQSVPAP